MTLVSGLVSVLTILFAALATLLVSALDSDFLFVTGAFNFSESGFAAGFDKDFPTGLAVDLAAALGVALGVDLETSLVDVFSGDFALVMRALAMPLDLAVPPLAPGFAVALEAAACFAFFAEDDTWVFAGFFIAFAMESTAKWVVLVTRENASENNQSIAFR